MKQVSKENPRWAKVTVLILFGLGILKAIELVILVSRRIFW